MELPKNGDLAGFGVAISKLIETVAKGIGVLYEPTNRVRLAKADAQMIGIISAAIAENDELNKLSIFYDDGKITIESKVSSNTEISRIADSTSSHPISEDDFNEYKKILSRSIERTVYQEVTKEINIETIVEKAAILLKDYNVVSKDPVGLSWSNAFFDSAGYASDPEIQNIWGEILCAEVREPGRTSMRTLDTIKKLSQKEALLFDSISDYILNAEDEKNNVTDYFIFSDDIVLTHMGVTFPEMLTLVDANLLMYNGGTVSVGYKLKMGESRKVYVGKSVVFEIKNDTYKEMDAMKPAILLTEAGREIYSILYKNKVDKNKTGYYRVCKEYMIKDG